MRTVFVSFAAAAAAVPAAPAHATLFFNGANVSSMYGTPGPVRRVAELDIFKQACYPINLIGLPPIICYFEVRNYGNTAVTKLKIYEKITVEYKTGPWAGKTFTGELLQTIDVYLPPYSSNPEARYVSSPINPWDSYGTWGEAVVTFTSRLFKTEYYEIVTSGMAPAPLVDTYKIEEPSAPTPM